MKILFVVLVAVYAFAFSTEIQANAFSADAEESIYRNYLQQYRTQAHVPVMPQAAEEQKLALDAIEDALINGTELKPQWFTIPEELELNAYERVRWIRLRAKYGAVGAGEEMVALRLARGKLDARMKEELRLLRPALKSEAAKAEIESLLPFAKAKEYSAPSAKEVKALFNELPDLAGFQGGRYAGWPRIFVFCRHDHNYGCLLAMRDKNNLPVKENGQLWLQPALGLSSRGVPYDQRNGNTPQGVQLVDGVMPVADMPLYYGKFRRMILNFVPASAQEVEQRKLLPKAVGDWWREAVVARDMGRNLLRIHGVGELNPDPSTLYYPFIPTIGCLAQLEGKYGTVDYIDQRKLLDKWMAAAGLEPKFENEPNIRGLMYFIEMNDERRPVLREDLRAIGIW